MPGLSIAPVSAMPSAHAETAREKRADKKGAGKAFSRDRSQSHRSFPTASELHDKGQDRAQAQERTLV